jgi:hypothetical protein
MKQTESECVGCGLPCIGCGCPHYEVTRFFCDECGDETTLFHYDGRELCIKCVEDLLEKVEE